MTVGLEDINACGQVLTLSEYNQANITYILILDVATRNLESGRIVHYDLEQPSLLHIAHKGVIEGFGLHSSFRDAREI